MDKHTFYKLFNKAVSQFDKNNKSSFSLYDLMYMNNNYFNNPNSDYIIDLIKQYFIKLMNILNRKN